MLNCKRCMEEFPHIGALTNHLKKKKECPGTFDRTIQLEELTVLKNTECNNCGKIFSSRQRLQTHMDLKVCQRDSPVASCSQTTETEQEVKTLRTEMAGIRQRLNELTKKNKPSSSSTSNSHNTTNIQLNFFGEEDVSYITGNPEQFRLKMEERILSNNIIEQFCYHLLTIFFHPDVKENHTITGYENGNITIFKKLRKRGSYQAVPEKEAIVEIATRTAIHYKEYFASYCPNDKVSREKVVSWVEQIGDFVNLAFTIQLFQTGTTNPVGTEWIEVNEDELTPEKKIEREERKQEFYKTIADIIRFGLKIMEYRKKLCNIIAQTFRETLGEKLQCDVEVS